MIRKIISVILSLALFASLFVSCGVKPDTESDGKLKLTATLFPQYEFAKAVAGDKAKVTLLLPPGTEAHMYDPTPNDISAVYKSDMFLYTGDDMEPWAKSVISSAPKSVKICDISKAAELKHNEHELDLLTDSHDEHDCEHHENDTHFWLDLNNSIKAVGFIRDELSAIDKYNADYYADNAKKYIEKLQKLKAEYNDALSIPNKKVLAFGGKFSYYYLIDEFSLKYISAYDDCCSESEPSVKRIVDIINFIEKNDIKVIYYEELSEPVIARQISNQTGAELLLLHTCHNLSKEDFENGVSYIDLMEQNLKNLKEGIK